MMESAIFMFPGITVTPPHSSSSTGYLVLLSSPQRNQFFDPSSSSDIYLRLQHTPDKPSSSSTIDCLIEAWRELRKTSPREFVLATEFGDLYIAFPELHQPIPVDDPRIVNLPAEVTKMMTWKDIVTEFETEIDRFVSYTKNNYSLISSPFGDAGSSSTLKKQPYDSEARDEKNAGDCRVVLVDEENGSEVGEVGGYQVRSVGVTPGSKDPVEITFPEAGQEEGVLTVRPANYLEDVCDPAYQNSRLVQTASTVSRLIVGTSVYISNSMQKGARSFTEKTQPNVKPMTFKPSTHERFSQVHMLTSTAARFSSATLGRVSTLAQNAGAKLAGNERGRPRNPGLLNKSLIAFSTIADGIDYASKSILTTGSQAATSMVHHKYGAEAGNVARSLTSSFRNVGVVYIDASGVSRRAVIKGVAKGMVVGRVKDGQEVIVPPDQVDGLPAGWGDGPLGGPHAGPPTPSLASPPGYPTNGLYNGTAPPHASHPMPMAYENTIPREKGEFRV